MRKLRLFILLFVSALFFTNCEQDVVKTLDDTKESGERISFLKTSSYSSRDDDQDPFQMLYAEIQRDTVVNFIMEYAVGEEYKPHEFDFVWNGKFEEDADGKKWMNIEIFHKTREENKMLTVSDSANVHIPDFVKIKEEDIDKTWLKLINSTDDSNVIILKYKENITEDGGDEVPVDSTAVSPIANLSN